MMLPKLPVQSIEGVQNDHFLFIYPSNECCCSDKWPNHTPISLCVLNRIRKRNIVYRLLTYLFMVVASFILYPIGISQGFLSLLLMVITYFYVGGIFYGLHSSPLMAFVVAFILQGFGLVIRFLIRLQTTPEVGMLTEKHFLLYLIVVPIFITIIYFLVPLFLKMEKETYAYYRK